MSGPAVGGALADVLPAVADLLGAPVREEPSPLTAALREAHDGVEQVCVLLVDGLGERLLAARGGHAPRMRSMAAAAGAPGAAVVAAGYPSTTATSTASIGTGLHPGQHGVVGYQVRDPATGVLFNELSWETAPGAGGPGAGAAGAPPPDPRRWQPHPTAFENLAAAGAAVTRVGPGFFDGSGLTEATSRGGRFRAASSLPARVEAGLGALRSAARERTRALVHVYWGDLDKAGHTHGWASAPWSDELERVDAAVADLVAGLPPRALLLVTGDHGMVDVPADARWDVAAEPDLAAGVEVVAGEPRAPQLHCRPGAASDVLAAWRERLGHVLEVISREEAVEAGWFGPHGVDAAVLERTGDVVAAATAPASVHDSRVQRPELAGLVGMHGGRTPEEVLVPLLVAAPAPPRRARRR